MIIFKNIKKDSIPSLDIRHLSFLSASLESLNQTLKVVIAVKFDFNLAFLARLFNHDFSPEMAG